MKRLDLGVAGLAILFAVQAGLQLVPHPATEGLVPAAWRSPEPALRAAYQSLRHQPDADPALALAATGVALAPWYGPAWLIYALASERVDQQAALPFFALALHFDPRGRGTIEASLPRLVESGWLAPIAALPYFLNSQLGAAAAVLPAQPPPDWPAAYIDKLTGAAVHMLFGAGKPLWLAGVEQTAFATQLDANSRSYVMASFCIQSPTLCLARYEACLANDAGLCPDGIRPTRPLIWAVSDAVRATGDRERTVQIARQVLELDPTRTDVIRLAERLEEAGQQARARQLLRVHPAMAR